MDLQLEAVYRQRLAEVGQAVKRRLVQLHVQLIKLSTTASVDCIRSKPKTCPFNTATLFKVAACQ